MNRKPILRRIFLAAHVKRQLPRYPGFEARVRTGNGQCLNTECSQCPMEIPSFGCLTLYMRRLDDVICCDPVYITLADVCRDLGII